MELAESVSVSRRYILQIAGKLRNGGLIGVNKGMSGGFHLLRAPEEISMYDIIALMEGGVNIPSGAEDGYMALGEAFDFLRDCLETYLRMMTLERLSGVSIDEWGSLVADMARKRIDALTAKD
jgi:Rrf2 family protein